jgi:hypothetical protein
MPWDRAVQKGPAVSVLHVFSFDPSRPVQQLVRRFFVSMGAAMDQLSLRLFGRLDGPSVAPPHVIDGIRNYREAVRVCWGLRRAKGLTVTDLAREFGFNRQHASDYLNRDDKPGRRDLPAERITAFEEVCGNAVISQWLARRSKLTVLEQLQAGAAEQQGRAAA